MIEHQRPNIQYFRIWRRGGGHKQRRCQIHIKQSEEGKKYSFWANFLWKSKTVRHVGWEWFYFSSTVLSSEVDQQISEILERKKINHCGCDAIFLPLICQCENFSRKKKKSFNNIMTRDHFKSGGGKSAIKMQTIPKKPLAKSKAQSNRCHSVVKC